MPDLDSSSPLHRFEQQVQATADSQKALAQAADELQQRACPILSAPVACCPCGKHCLTLLVVSAEIQAARSLAPAPELTQQCSRLPKLEQRARRVAETLAIVQARTR